MREAELLQFDHNELLFFILAFCSVQAVNMLRASHHMLGRRRVIPQTRYLDQLPKSVWVVALLTWIEQDGLGEHGRVQWIALHKGSRNRDVGCYSSFPRE